MTRISRFLFTAVLAAGLLVLLTPVANAQITGTKTRVTWFVGDQYDPAIDGTIIVYTDDLGGATGDDVRYVDVSGDTSDPGNHIAVVDAPGDQRLHDVSGDTIVFTDYSTGVQRVFEYDIPTGVATELATAAGNPTVDGNQVVFESLGGVGGATEVGLADLTTGTAIDITATTDWEANPAIGGQYVAFERSPTATGAKTVVVRDLIGGGEVNLGAGREAHTDGRTVVYVAENPATFELDVYVYDIADGTPPVVLARAGDQYRPRVDADFVAFDETVGPEQDVIVLHLPSGDFTEVGNGAVESLNDLSGNRVAFTSYGQDASGGSTARDVFVFDFVHGTPTTENPCEDLSGLTLEAAWDFQREQGSPTQHSETFTADFDRAVVVVRNNGCASGLVELNGERVVSPSDLSPELTCSSGVIEVAGENTLDVEARSAPGCVLSVEVYSVDDSGG